MEKSNMPKQLKYMNKIIALELWKTMVQEKNNFWTIQKTKDFNLLWEKNYGTMEKTMVL